MTDGIKFEQMGTESVYVLTKKGADGKKATITVNDFNKNGFDNNDGFIVSDPTSIFTAGEISKALAPTKYSDQDRRTSQLPTVPTTNTNGKIAVENGKKYNLGSFVKTLRKMKDQDSVFFASTEVSPAKAEAPAPASASESAPASAPASNIDPSAIQQFQYKWASALSSLVGSSYCGDGSFLNLLMPSFLNAMFAEANGVFGNMNPGANIDYSAMPDGAGYSDIAIPAMPAIPAADQSGAAAVVPAQTAEAKAKAEAEAKAEAKAAAAKQKEAGEAFTKTKQLAIQLGITIDPTDTNETLSVKIQTEKNRLAAEKKKQNVEDIASKMYLKMKDSYTPGDAGLTNIADQITTSNVIEVMDYYDEKYKSKMNGQTLTGSINDSMRYGHVKIKGVGTLSATDSRNRTLDPIKNALIARAKALGMTADVNVFENFTKEEMNSFWTGDSEVEERFEEMRQAIKAKEAAK